MSYLIMDILMMSHESIHPGEDGDKIVISRSSCPAVQDRMPKWHETNNCVDMQCRVRESGRLCTSCNSQFQCNPISARTAHKSRCAPAGLTEFTRALCVTRPHGSGIHLAYTR